MPPTIRDLGIDRLSPADRLRLIGEIWDSLTTEEQLQEADIPCEELDCRIAEANADPSAGLPWDEVGARLRNGR